jgi:hypothetical protein
MTDTTNKPMTLEEVRDWHRKEAAFRRSFDPNNSMIHKHAEMADAIDAHIAAQRDGDGEVVPSYFPVWKSRMPNYLRAFIEGMSVSVDVSTGEDDYGNRYYGTVTEVMDAPDKHGVTLLVQDAEPNFTVQPCPAAAVTDAMQDAPIDAAEASRQLSALVNAYEHAETESTFGDAEYLVHEFIASDEVWGVFEQLYSKQRKAVTVTEDEIDVACIAAAKAYGGTIQPADVDRIAVRAALEAVMKGK